MERAEDPELRAELFKSARPLVTDAFAWHEEWDEVRQRTLQAMREAELPYDEKVAPAPGKANHGDLYYYNANGHSFWIILSAYGGVSAYELLPSEQDPREKPALEIQEKADYLGRAKRWFILRWHRELLP
jgi:hypothetical protein